MTKRRTTARQARYGVARILVHLARAGLLLALCAAPATAGRLVWAFGDSLTAGYGLPPADGFPNRLEQALRAAGIDAAVRNGGVSGDTSAQGQARLRWGLRGLGRTPDLVIVEFGANDMLRGLPPAETRRNLALILAELGRRRIPVLLAGMRAAPNMGADYAAAFEAIYPDLARTAHVRLYPFFLDGAAGHPALLQADGRHPNARGVGIVTARILPAVRAGLRPPRPAPRAAGRPAAR